jgi:hypothetical protein
LLRARLGGLDRRPRRELRLDFGVELALRDGPLLSRRRIALDVERGFAELRLSLCEVRSGL